jgi:hypothetical protein
MGGKCLGFAVAVAGPQWPRKVGSSIKDPTVPHAE